MRRIIGQRFYIPPNSAAGLGDYAARTPGMLPIGVIVGGVLRIGFL